MSKRCILLALLVAPFIVSVRSASAHGVVGTGSPDTCTEASFDAALAGGGVVTFNCGGNPFTLALSRARIIDKPTTIDGGGQITISGNGTFRLFEARKTTFEVKNLTLTGGAGKESSGSDEVGGGAINAWQGKLLIINSTLSNNTAPHGGAIACRFCQPLTVQNSIFTQNRATSPFLGGSGGGAIHLSNISQMTIAGSTFANNTSAGDGGALANYGSSIKIDRSTFTTNQADQTGGAIFNSRGTLTIWDSRLIGNVASGSGGAIKSGRNGIEIGRSTLANNRASSGGAISLANGGLKILDSTLSGNIATTTGGAIGFALGPLGLSNTTITGNKAESGSAIEAGAAAIGLTNSTVAGNIATKPDGGALAGGAFLNLSNTIIANNVGGNCAKPSKFAKLLDYGGNLQFPESTCGGIPSKDPALDPAGLKDNGGTTQTIGLQPNSPAIRAGNSANCMQFDQRGVKRPNPCSSGAFEPS